MEKLRKLPRAIMGVKHNDYNPDSYQDVFILTEGTTGIRYEITYKRHKHRDRVYDWVFGNGTGKTIKEAKKNMLKILNENLTTIKIIIN